MSESAVLFRTGDAVWIECAGVRAAGTVELASTNGKSLMLAFDALIDGHLGAMPVLQGDDGVFRSLVTDSAISIRTRVPF